MKSLFSSTRRKISLGIYIIKLVDIINRISTNFYCFSKGRYLSGFLNCNKRIFECEIIISILAIKKILGYDIIT